MKLPDSVVKLQQLRYLDLDYTRVNSVPKGFRALTNLRALYGFPAYLDSDWCSLEELGPLSHLIELGLKDLENVTSTSSTMKAMLGARVHLTVMKLECNSRLGNNGLLKGAVSEKDHGIIEEVFDELYPPPCIEKIQISGYFGRRLPKWTMLTVATPPESLRFLSLWELVCCTQLPDGLCQLPYLEDLKFNRALAIRHVGPEFV